jgi:DNA-binding NarL/FixJ family response regulator
MNDFFPDFVNKLNMIRIVLADNHTILRDGLQAILANDNEIKIVGEAPNGKVLVDILETTPVDLVILDVNMPVMNGLEATRHIVQYHNNIRVLVLTTLENSSNMQLMIGAGAKGYILKSAGKNDLIYAIKQVAKDRIYISPEMIMKQEITDEKVKFTKRELQVLELIADGLTNKEIAEKIFLSKRTVETHRMNLIDKTNSKNTSVLIKYAISNGILKTF